MSSTKSADTLANPDSAAYAAEGFIFDTYPPERPLNERLEFYYKRCSLQHPGAEPGGYGRMYWCTESN